MNEKVDETSCGIISISDQEPWQGWFYIARGR
jgi:hypothetical protein